MRLHGKSAIADRNLEAANSNAAQIRAAFPTNLLTGQSLIVSHGWFME